MRMKQKKYFFWRRKKSKWPIFQNGRFLKSPIFEIFLRKFYRLVLVLVGLIDAKSFNVAQPIWSWGCLWHKGKNWQKKAFFVFLAFFCPYIRQPHNHISWATLMGFLSMNPTNSRTGLWNFREKISRIGDFEIWPFW